MDKNYYRDQIVKERLLFKVYKEVSVGTDKKVLKNLKKYKSILTKNESDYWINFKFTINQFYCLPKAHKSKIIKNVISTENSEHIQIHCPKI